MHSPGGRNNKIRGWLLFVAVALVLNLISMVHFTVNVFGYSAHNWPEKPTYVRIWTNQETGTTWQSVGHQTDPYRRLFLIGELSGIILLLMFSIILLVLFIQRRKIFPNLTILYLVCLNVLFIAGLWGVHRFLDGGYMAEELDLLLRRAVISAVLIPYLLYSKRVKGTFIR